MRYNADMEDPVGRTAYIQTQKAEGRRVAAVFPARYPAPVLWAHGVLPVEVWDPPADASASGGALPAFVCGVVRAGFGWWASGGLSAADCLLFPHTCDSLQNLATVVRDLRGEPRPCLTFYPPRAGASGAETYAAAQARALSEALERAFPGGAAPRWDEALALGRRLDAALLALYDARAAGRLRASSVDFYAAVRACEWRWPADAAGTLETFAREHAGPSEGRVRVVLSGVLPSPAGLLSALDEMGVAVAEDDLIACGRRLLRRPVEEGPTPFDTAARRLMALPPCSTAGSPTAERIDFVAGLAGRAAARAVVAVSLPFCEPERFETPALTRGLKERGLSVLVLEAEPGGDLPAGARTRLEAFLESL